MKRRIYVAKSRQVFAWPEGGNVWPDMWYGYCTCGAHWQFWFFGATLGYGLEHLRRDHVKIGSVRV